MLKRTVITLCALLLTVSLVDLANAASKYPSRPIEIVVPFAAGGGNDILARAVAGSIKLPQPMVIVNIQGGSGTIGTMEVFNAKPDGYKLLMHSFESLVSLLFSGVDKARCYEMPPIATLAYDYDMLATSSNNKNFSNLQEFVAYAKANPGKVNIGGAGAYGRIQATSETIIKALGIDANYVSYDSGSKTRTAALGGHVDAIFFQTSEGAASVKSGELVALAVTGEKRLSMLPDAPTFKEQGYDITSGMSRGIIAPKNMPQDVVNVLDAAIRDLFKDEKFLDIVRNKLNFEPMYLNSADSRAHNEKAFPQIEKLMTILKKK